VRRLQDVRDRAHQHLRDLHRELGDHLDKSIASAPPPE
jgi:hypothetical protein